MRLRRCGWLSWLLILIGVFASGCKKPQEPDSVRDGAIAKPAKADEAAGTQRNIGLGSYEGNLELVGKESLVGWAWDSSRPDVPIKVEIFCDGITVATVTADQARKDLLSAKKGDGRHGFIYPTPDRMRDGKEHKVTVTIAETKGVIGQKILTLAKAQ